MGWIIGQACGSKKNHRENPINYLEIIVSSENKQAIAQIEKFMKYLDQNVVGLLKGVDYADIDNIHIRYYDLSRRMKEIYQGNDLTEDKYAYIISQVKWIFK